MAPVPCRIHGLTSEAGKALNGAAGFINKMDPSAGSTFGARQGVAIFGFPDNKAVKTENLEFITLPSTVLGIGVGRNFLRDTFFNAIATQDDGDGFDPSTGFPVVLRENISGECTRARGNLLVLKQLLARSQSAGCIAIQVRPTDLNIVRAANLVAAGGSCALPPPLDMEFEELAQLIQAFRAGGGQLLCTFDPHRSLPDASQPHFEGRGRERVAAVCRGCYLVYPAPNPGMRDALEVRYAGEANGLSGFPPGPRSRQERFLDTGRAEVFTYLDGAIAVGDEARLLPEALAAVDPQAFWAAVVRIDAWVHALSAKGCVAGAAAWAPLLEGAQGAAVARRTSGVGTHRALLVEEDGWDVATDAAHLEVGVLGALAALHMVVEHPAFGGGPVRLDFVEDERGTDFGRTIETLARACAGRWATGKKLSKPKWRAALNKELVRLGLGEDALELKNAPLSSCGNCKGADDKLSKCAGCAGVAYCSKECQKADWKRHKAECAGAARTVCREAPANLAAQGVAMEPRLYQPGAVDEGPQLYTDATGCGSVAILWLGEGKASQIVYSSSSASGIGAPSQPVAFTQFSDLSPAEELLVSCGPLPSLQRVQAALPRALAANGGNAASIRVRGAGFTALEWAARKGNLDIVKWLISDERTKGLVTVGAPVGWACYTGRVEVARALVAAGADPTATDEGLWGNLPPLLTAAQNGQLEIMKWLVDDLGQDIRMRCLHGGGVEEHIKTSENWRDVPGNVGCAKWVEERLAPGR